MRVARTLSAVLSVVLLTSSLPALADNESDAKDLFTKGRELRSKGDCASAIPLFRKAAALYPQGLGSLRNLAECEEQVGHFASSRRAWLDLKRALLVSTDAKYDGWQADADAAAARLAPKVAEITLSITVKSAEGKAPMSAESGLQITINGETIDPKLVDVPLDRDPGTYTVRVEGGKKPVQASMTVRAGDREHVDLVVEAKEQPADAAPQPPAAGNTPETPKGDGSGLKTAGYVAFGVGAVGLFGMGIAIAMRQSALSDLKAHCPTYETGRCSGPDATAASKDADRGSTAATLANVFGAVAIAGVAFGVGFVIAGSAKDASKRGAMLSPWASTNGGGAALWGRF